MIRNYPSVFCILQNYFCQFCWKHNYPSMFCIIRNYSNMFVSYKALLACFVYYEIILACFVSYKTILACFVACFVSYETISQPKQRISIMYSLRRRQWSVSQFLWTQAQSNNYLFIYFSLINTFKYYVLVCTAISWTFFRWKFHPCTTYSTIRFLWCSMMFK